MAKKPKITQEQACEWADAALKATDPLLELVEQVGKLGVDGFDEKATKIAVTLAVVASRAAEAAQAVLRHFEISTQLSAQQREVDALRAKAEGQAKGV